MLFMILEILCLEYDREFSESGLQCQTCERGGVGGGVALEIGRPM